jgi:hypothetical protein
MGRALDAMVDDVRNDQPTYGPRHEGFVWQPIRATVDDPVAGMDFACDDGC